MNKITWTKLHEDDIIDFFKKYFFFQTKHLHYVKLKKFDIRLKYFILSIFTPLEVIWKIR